MVKLKHCLIVPALVITSLSATASEKQLVGKQTIHRSGEQSGGGRIYELWEPAPAPNRGHDYSVRKPGRGYPYDADWEKWSYPMGNGTLGANVFGRTDVERIQLTEKTIANGSAYDRGGLTSAAELYLDFEHGETTDYRRALVLNDGSIGLPTNPAAHATSANTS